MARHLGLSPSTVSLSLRAKGRISPATRQRVLTACRELQYQPHPAAQFLPSLRSLPNSRVATNAFAFTTVVQPGRPPTYAGFLEGAARSAIQRRKTIIYQSLEIGMESDLARFSSFRVDGRLLIGEVDDSTLQFFQDENVPLIVVGEHRCQRPVWNVLADDRAAGRLAANHLWTEGHRRIGFFRDPAETNYQNECLRGVQETIRKLGGESVHLPILANRMEDREPLLALLRQEDRPTAFVTLCGESVAALTLYAREAGLAVPRDLELVVYDALPRTPSQKFTYINQGGFEMGRRAMEIMMSLAEKGEPEIPCRILVQPQLIARVCNGG